jgi:hypothetical protein
MKKLLIPLVCLLISFTFTGATISKSLVAYKCGPQITINNNSPWTVTKVEVTIVASGTVHVYNNPTFPFVYGGAGGNVIVTYFFNTATAGTIYWESASDCDSDIFWSNTSFSIAFSATCQNYSTTIANKFDFGCPY